MLHSGQRIRPGELSVGRAAKELGMGYNTLRGTRASWNFDYPALARRHRQVRVAFGGEPAQTCHASSPPEQAPHSHL